MTSSLPQRMESIGLHLASFIRGNLIQSRIDKVLVTNRFVNFVSSIAIRHSKRRASAEQRAKKRLQKQTNKQTNKNKYAYSKANRFKMYDQSFLCKQLEEELENIEEEECRGAIIRAKVKDIELGGGDQMNIFFSVFTNLGKKKKKKICYEKSPMF